MGSDYVDQIPCGKTISGPRDGFSITVSCEAQGANAEQTLSSTTVADQDSACTSVEFDIDTGQCRLYHDSDNSYATVAAASMVYAYFPHLD